MPLSNPPMNSQETTSKKDLATEIPIELESEGIPVIRNRFVDKWKLFDRPNQKVVSP
jgi:hypothetical protein